MATILNKHRQDIQQNNKARTLASFFRSQLILFNSRKKHGILYSVATAAGLFCIPGILSVMGSETEVQLLIQMMAVSGIMIFVSSIVNDLGDTKGDKAAGRRTIPIVLGGENTIKMLIILLGSMPAISWILYGVFVEHDTRSIITPIAVTIVASLALLRMTIIERVFEDMKLIREQHKKWFPLYMLLQSGIVVGSLLPL